MTYKSYQNKAKFNNLKRKTTFFTIWLKLKKYFICKFCFWLVNQFNLVKLWLIVRGPFFGRRSCMNQHKKGRRGRN